MSEDDASTIRRLQATIENLQKDLRAMRIGREEDDLRWRKLWEKEKRKADEAHGHRFALVQELHKLGRGDIVEAVLLPGETKESG